MQLGFIGTGEITSSIVTGLSSPGVPAKGLANRFDGISVAFCNQEVLDHSDAIVHCMFPGRPRLAYCYCASTPGTIPLSSVKVEPTVPTTADLRVSPARCRSR
jgi:hypothetical protein